MITNKQQQRISGLLNTSVDDCRISIQSDNDLPMLEHLLTECHARQNTSRAQIVKRRINKIITERKLPPLSPVDITA